MKHSAYLEYLRLPVDKWIRFDHKQMWYATVGNVTILKSYDTRVGVVKNGVLYWAEKYSPTTSKQLTQYANRFNLTKEQVVD
jgi:hypothetical protein